MNMKFGLILGGVTLVTLVLIFGVYRIFLYSPAPAPTPLPQKQVVAQPSVESLPVSSETPAASQGPAASKIPGQRAVAIPIRSTIGTISVISDTTTGTSAAGNSTISGSINIAGTPPSGTSVVIVARKNGSVDQYKTVASGINASSGTAWVWTAAANGTAYDLIAILKGSTNGVDTDYAQSQTYVVSAPALNQIFSINAASAPSAPSGTATITCGAKAANNTWSANVNFPSVSGAAFYKMQIGSTSGDDDISNISQAAQSGTNQSINVTINDSVVYFAQYSVANTANPTAVQYSAFSTPVEVKCP